VSPNYEETPPVKSYKCQISKPLLKLKKIGVGIILSGLGLIAI